MKLINNNKYLQRNISQKVLESQTTADFTSRVSKSYVPFTCKFPMVMHFVPILHQRCRSKTNFYVFIYDKTSLKFCASFIIFLAVFMEKLKKKLLSELREKRNSLKALGIILKEVVCFEPGYITEKSALIQIHRSVALCLCLAWHVKKLFLWPMSHKVGRAFFDRLHIFETVTYMTEYRRLYMWS